MRSAFLLTLLMFGASGAVLAQTGVPNPLDPPNRIPGERRRDPDPVARRMEEERFRQLNKERQQKLKDDTEKLLKLANELKDFVDKTNENVLSLDVIRKAEEIEKLAKSVKERMKQEQTPATPSPI